MVHAMRQLGALACIFVLAACGADGREGGDGDTDGGMGSDSGSGSGSGAPGTTAVFAHTSTQLYRIDPDTYQQTMIGTFSFGNDTMTDIAIDKTGLMIGVSFTKVYRVDPTTAATTLLSSGLTGTFNGLSFIPADQVGSTGDDVLVGTRNADGKVFRIDPSTGSATEIGDMNGYTSSGDLVAVEGFGTVLTADNGISNDRLVRLAPSTFAATVIGTDIGVAEIWGVGFWKDKIYGFTSGGKFLTIDPATGVGTVIQNTGPAWYGAAVTTAAPVIQ
jgi:hypothetical protein